MEEIVYCPKCSFKCVKSQLYKSGGKCPICQTLISRQINQELKE